MRVLDGILDLDRRLLLVLQQSEGWFAQHSRKISRTADGDYYLLIALTLMAVGTQSRLIEHLMLAFLVERISYWVLKNGLRRKRPAAVLPGFRSVIIASDEFSFPSGHSSAAFLFVTVLVMHLGPAFALLYLWSTSVALSRIYLGVHYPTDTLVGSLHGVMFALATFAVQS
ncbi:MAG: phosphatase PAP2 family protein [Congregibacter sp.]